jgi:hypothetical protein
MSSQTRSRRQPASIRDRMIQDLEPRRLMAAPPVIGGPNFAAADDTYNLTVTPNSGATIAAATPVTSVAWGVSTNAGTGGGQALFDTFRVTVRSGPASPTFLRWVATGLAMTVKVESKTADGLVRGSWLLEAAIMKTFTQSIAPDGSPQDEVGFSLNKITDTFDRYKPDNNLLDETIVSWNRASGTGTNTGASFRTFDSDYLATTPDITQTLEYGAGQLPVSNTAISFVNSGTATTPGTSSAIAINHDSIDGREGLALFVRTVTGVHVQGATYELRDPASGAALQRYRFGDVVEQRYAFSDSTFDNVPRVASGTLIAAKYNLFDYSYSGANGEFQSSTSYGFQFASGAPWAPGGYAAHVPAPTSGAVNAAVNSVTFRFQSPIALTLSALSFEGFTTAGLTLTAADANQTWTVGNLAPQQAVDGHYAVKLLAYKFNPNTSGESNILIGSAGRSWDLDHSSPVLVDTNFDFDAAPPTPYAFDFRLSEPVTATAIDGTAPILIRRVDTGALVTTATAHVTPDDVTLTANLGNTLADNRYRATLPAGSVRDAAGNLLTSDLDLPFFVLAGDANRDAKVDFQDLVILAQNYNQSARSFATGNFNYSSDGKVDFADLVILAQQYNKSLLSAPIAAPANPTKTSGRKPIASGIIL